MSFQPKIDPKKLKSARAASMVQRAIQKALIQSGLKQQQVADKLGVDRSVINRRLKGNANLTVRSLAEFAYAFDKELQIRLVDARELNGDGWNAQASKIVKSSENKHLSNVDRLQSSPVYSKMTNETGA